MRRAAVARGSETRREAARLARAEYCSCIEGRTGCTRSASAWAGASRRPGPLFVASNHGAQCPIICIMSRRSTCPISASDAPACSMVVAAVCRSRCA